MTSCISHAFDSRDYVDNVVFGDLLLSTPSDHHFIVEVQEFYFNQYYDVETYEADLALIKLAEPVTFTDHVRPVCLSNQFQTYRRCQIAGWGLKYETGTISKLALLFSGYIKFIWEKFTSNNLIFEWYLLSALSICTIACDQCISVHES